MVTGSGHVIGMSGLSMLSTPILSVSGFSAEHLPGLVDGGRGRRASAARRPPARRRRALTS